MTTFAALEVLKKLEVMTDKSKILKIRGNIFIIFYIIDKIILLFYAFKKCNKILESSTLLGLFPHFELSQFLM